jgi:uncharacterized protein (TIGR02284 family)
MPTYHWSAIMDFQLPHTQPINEEDAPPMVIEDDLKTLYTLNYKAVEGFQQAAEAAENVTLRDALRSFAEVHQTYLEALASQLSAMGVEPDTKGFYEVVGSLHQAWLELAQAIAGGDPRTIIGECLTGETLTRNHYNDTVRDLPATEEITTLLNAQYEGVTQIVTKLEEMQAAYDMRD